MMQEAAEQPKAVDCIVLCVKKMGVPHKVNIARSNEFHLGRLGQERQEPKVFNYRSLRPLFLPSMLFGNTLSQVVIVAKRNLRD
mmetsp:Transcript_112976/g.241156  ORF Transcript_112976/g.241156 Transcript_112976/m.241156 type:complete len:84 (+) Transcript_112976:324-575(+)